MQICCTCCVTSIVFRALLCLTMIILTTLSFHNVSTFYIHIIKHTARYTKKSLSFPKVVITYHWYENYLIKFFNW